MMAPIVERVAEGYAGKLKVGKCNIDENMGLAQKYQVLSIPTFIIFKDGKPLSALTGVVTPDALREKMEAV